MTEEIKETLLQIVALCKKIADEEHEKGMNERNSYQRGNHLGQAFGVLRVAYFITHDLLKIEEKNKRGI